MRILLVKTSSLGDVIHNLPVVSDIARALPAAQVDWCVEEAFAAIPALHPGVSRVIPVAVRRWRRSLLSAPTLREMRDFRRRLQERRYDAIVDTQGLLKSALMTRLARGRRLGYAADSAREPMAARFYAEHFSVARDCHAVERNRRLAAAALGYRHDPATVDYGLAIAPLSAPWLPPRPYVVCLSATSRDDKLWPEAHWIELIASLAGHGIAAVLPAGSSSERERAQRIAAAGTGSVVAPPLELPALAALLRGARATVGVDTGLSHLAAAVGSPVVALYTASDPGLTGVVAQAAPGGVAALCRNLGGRGLIPAVDAVVASLATLLR